jgi:hypothetical protein
LVKTLTLREAIANSTLSDLRGIATLLGIPNAAASSKVALVELLMTPLGSAAGLMTALRALNPDELLALEALIDDGGAAEFNPFQAYFGEIRRAAGPSPSVDSGTAETEHFRPRFGEKWTGGASASQPSFLPRPSPLQPQAGETRGGKPGAGGDGPAKPEYWQHPQSPLESIWYKGLVFSMGIGYAQTLFIPSDVLPILAPLVTNAHKTVPLNPLVGQFQPGPMPDLLGDLLQFLLLIKKEGIKPVHDWRLPKRLLVTLDSRLSVRHGDIAEVRDESDAPYTGLLHRLLLTLRLMSDDGATFAPTVGAVRWLQRGRLDRMKELWGLFREKILLDETPALPVNVFIEAERLAAARGQVIKLVGACPPDKWVSLSALSRKVRHDHPQFLRGWHRRDARVYRDSDGRLVTAAASWDNMEGAYIKVVVSWPLNWFGLVQMEESDEAFRLTPLGAAVLGGKSTPLAEPAPSPIIVQPNFEILAPAEASHADVYRLEDFADLVKRDVVSTYTLTRNSLRGALEAGDSVDSVLDFLQTASGRDLPQNVAYSLREWAGQYGQIQLRRLTVVTTRSEAQLRELLSHPKLKLTAAEQLGPQAIALEAKEVRPFTTSLRRAGYMPIVEPDVDDASKRPSTLIPVRDVDLVPLLAAARLVCQLAESSPISAVMLDRLGEQLGAANRGEIARVVARLEDAVNDAGRAGDKGTAPAVHFNTALSLPALETAIRKRLTVQLEYYEEGRGSIIRQQVDPWRLERRRGQEYLVGFSHATLSERAYLLARIRSVTPTRDRFDPVSR